MRNGFIIGCDFTGDRSVDQLKAAGYDFAGIYMDGLPKDARQAFIDDALSKAFGILPIFERGGRGNASGAVAGTGHGQLFRSCLDAHKVPRDVAVVNAESDYDADPNNVGVRAYYPAFWSTLGQTVPGLNYAGGDVGRMAKAETGAGIMLTCSSGFRGSGNHDQVDIWQRCGPADHDDDYCLNPHLPIWNLHGVNPNPTPSGWVTVTEGMADGQGPLVGEHAYEVVEAQIRLERYAIDHAKPECEPGSDNGVLDYRTQNAVGAFKLHVIEFQQAFHLPVWPVTTLPVLHQIDEPTIDALRFFTTPAKA